MSRLNSINVYTIFLLIVAIAIGPVIFLTPFIVTESVHGLAVFGIDNIGLSLLARPFMISGFVVSLLTIFNLFEYEPETAKIPYWFYRFLRLITFLGCILGLVGVILVTRVRHLMLSDPTYVSVKLGVGFYITLLLFGLILLGFVLHWIKEEQALQKKKKDYPLPIDNP